MSPLEMAMASRLLSAAQPSCSNDLNDLMGGAGGWSQKKLRKSHDQSPHNKSGARPLPSFELFFSNPAAPSCLPLPFFQLSGLGALSSPKVFNCSMAVSALCSRHADVCCGHLTWGLEYLPWPLKIFLYSSFTALRNFLA